MLGCAAVVSHEIGGFMQSGTADYSDIPAGVIGSVAFVGFNMLLKRFIKDSGSEIKKLSTELNTQEN